MKSVVVENIKVAHDGNRGEPSKGGSRYPYFLFSGVVTLKFKEKRDIRIWSGDGRKTIKDFAVFDLKMEGVSSLPSGLSESFSYTAESDGNGFTVDPVKPACVMTVIKKLYVPVGHDYPYPTVYPWGKGHEQAIFNPEDRAVSPDNIHNWLLPGWGTNWTRERGGYQYKLAAR